MQAILGEVSTNWYIANTVLLVFVLTVHIVGQFAKKRKIPEIVETPMILHDEEKHEALYKMRSRMIFTIFIPMLALNTLFWVTDKSGIYAFIVTVLIALSVIAYFIALVIYTDLLERNWEKTLKQKGITPPRHEFSFSDVRRRSIARAFAVILALLVIGYIFFHIVHPHS